MLLLIPFDIHADHRQTILGEEYAKMQEGVYPKEVNFADTAFTVNGHAKTESVLTEINGSPSDEHEFDIKAGSPGALALSSSQ